MNNTNAAKMFLELADLVDLAGELPFKGASYRKVAESLNQLAEPFQEIVRQMEYEKITGAGKTIKEKLMEMALTEKLPALEKWRMSETAKFYQAVIDFGIRPRPLGILIKKYSATDLPDLVAKLQNDTLENLKGQAREAAMILLNNYRGK